MLTTKQVVAKIDKAFAPDLVLRWVPQQKAYLPNTIEDRAVLRAIGWCGYHRFTPVKTGSAYSIDELLSFIRVKGESITLETRGGPKDG